MSILHHVRHLPRHYLWPGVAIVIVLLLVMLRVVTGHHSTTPPQQATAGTSAPPAIAPPTTGAARTPAQAVPGTAATVGPVPATVVLAPPATVKAGYLHMAVLGQDQFGTWLSLSDQTIPASTLAVTVPGAQVGVRGARKYLYQTWVQVAHPVQTVTLRAIGGDAEIAAKIAGVTAQLGQRNPGSVVAPHSSQTVASIAPGWHRVRLAVLRRPYPVGQHAVRVEMQLGSANLDPLVPTPYWTPAKATSAKPAAVPARASTTAPVPAASTPTPVPAGSAAKATTAHQAAHTPTVTNSVPSSGTSRPSTSAPAKPPHHQH